MLGEILSAGTTRMNKACWKDIARTNCGFSDRYKEGSRGTGGSGFLEKINSSLSGKGKSTLGTVWYLKHSTCSSETRDERSQG